jgi:hypothetical protein
MSVKLSLKQYDEALKLCQRIQDEFPLINWGDLGKEMCFNWTVKQAQWQVDHSAGGPAKTAPSPGPRQTMPASAGAH